MGIIDLAVQNDSLLTKWSWELEIKSAGLWATTITTLYGITRATDFPSVAKDLFFLKSFSYLLPFYKCSTVRENGVQWG